MSCGCAAGSRDSRSSRHRMFAFCPTASCTGTVRNSCSSRAGRSRLQAPSRCICPVSSSVPHLVAGAGGVEPPQWEPKSHALPLRYAPVFIFHNESDGAKDPIHGKAAIAGLSDMIESTLSPRRHYYRLVGRRFHSSSTPRLTHTVAAALITELFSPTPAHGSYPFLFSNPEPG